MLRHATLVLMLRITRQEDTPDKFSQERNVVDTFTFGGQCFPTQWDVLFAALSHAGCGLGRSSSTSLRLRDLVNMFGSFSLLRVFFVRILSQLHHGLKYTLT